MPHRLLPAAVVLLLLAPAIGAQAPPDDEELARLSAGRAVTIGPLTGGPGTSFPLEVYVARVLAGEAEPGAPVATMQALAVAIRTYALFNMGKHASDGFDLCDTTHCQVPRTANADTRRAAAATAGRILTYRGAPAELFYSASCGGRSERASDAWPQANDHPYLRSVEDDVHDDDEPWTLELTLEEVRVSLVRAGFEGDRLRDIEIDGRTGSGRVAKLKLEGLRPDEAGGDQFRLAVGPRQLRSTAFTMQRRGERLVFTGRGYGHGVGMCVIGAGRRARRGETLERILEHYYPGLRLTEVSTLPASLAPPALRGLISVRVPGAPPAGAEIERVAQSAQAALAKALGVQPVPVTLTLHESLNSFRTATGQPFWVSVVARAGTIDLAPAPLLAQREGLEAAVRAGVAEMLVAPALADRPAWVRIGAARFFARQITAGAPRLPEAPRRLVCPADAELTLPASQSAQREAETRAEQCFARAYAETRDWRTVK